MPRKYELVRRENSGESWRSIPSDLRKFFAGAASSYEHVTAVDERDVSPLVEALREIGDAAKAQDADALEWATWAHDLAQERLKPFEAEEGSG